MWIDTYNELGNRALRYSPFKESSILDYIHETDIEIPSDKPIDLRYILDAVDIPLLTADEVIEKAIKESFFNHLKIPSFGDYGNRKTNKSRTTFKTWYKKLSDLQDSYSCVEEYIKSKVKKYIMVEIQKVENQVKELIPDLFLKYFWYYKGRCCYEIYTNSSDDRFITLDSYIYYYWMINVGILNKHRLLFDLLDLINIEELNKGKHLWSRKISIDDIVNDIKKIYKDVSYNFEDFIKALYYAPDVLRPFIKENTDFNLFEDNIEALQYILHKKYREYDHICLWKEVKSCPEVSKNQILQLANYMIKQDNVKAIPLGVVLGLLNSFNENELLETLLFKHYKHFSYSWIKDSVVGYGRYPENTITFLGMLLDKNLFEEIINLMTAPPARLANHSIKYQTNKLHI